ncbi:MAG: maleylpyruvate isomerase family mycothiol-dependent enzyme [Nocardioides sp.]
MTDQERLSALVDVWWRAVDDFTHLLEELPPHAWSAPTDLPGWDVHAVAAHTAHLEAILAGQPEETLELDAPAHATTLMQLYTEQGVAARRDRSPDELINEIRASAAARRTALLAEPPTDPAAKPERIFAGVPWSWETLLRNRPLDVWMHEQDVRRAVGRPGNLDSPAAQHTTDYLLESMGMVLAKRAAAPPGTTVVVEVQGSAPAAFEVGADGRGRPLAEPPTEPTVRLVTDRETFVLAAGGRRTPAPGAVQLSGDEELGRRVVAGMAVTP